MNTVIWVLGTLIALEIAYVITSKSIYIQEWLKSRPIRIDKNHNMYRYIEAFEIETIHQRMLDICDILSITPPKTYLVGNIGSYARKSYEGYILYKKQPIIVLYYDAKVIYTMAHELYHAWQRKNCPERYEGNTIKGEWVEQSEIEAQSFAIAYLESKAPYLKLKPNEWKHRDFSEEVKNNLDENGEMVVLRAMAEAFKEKYFKSYT